MLVNKKKLLVFIFFIFFTIINSTSGNDMQTIEKQTNKKGYFEVLKNKAKKYTLDNGLRVIFMQNGNNPTVALYWKIFAGSADEIPDNAGIAHMLEHMLFKGTKKVGTIDFESEKKYLEVLNRWYHKYDALLLEKEKFQNPELDKKIEKIHKRIQLLEDEVKKFQISEEDSILYSIHGERGYNAYTSKDVTNYQIQLPANRIEVWARLESDRIQNSVFREFYTERYVVAEERRMRIENNPAGYLYENFLKEIYKNHPYGLSTIGPMNNILYFKKETAIEFYQKYYRPDNTVIAIVGNFDENYALDIIKKYFGNWKKPSNPIPRNPVNDIVYNKVDLKIAKEGSPIQFLAWLKPSFPSMDDLALDILSNILSGREDTRLYKKLVLEEKLVSRIAIYSNDPGERYSNLFFIYIQPNLAILKNPEDHQEIQQLYQKILNSIYKEIDKIIQNGISEEEIYRVKQMLLLDFTKKMRSNSFLADTLTYYEILYNNYEYLFDYYDKIQQIDSRKIQESAKEYLTKEKIYIAELYPEKKVNEAK